jgi:hypothetical protein
MLNIIVAKSIMSCITFIIRNNDGATKYGKMVDDCLREYDDCEYVEVIEKQLNEILNRINNTSLNRKFNIGILGITNYDSYLIDIHAFDIFIDMNQNIIKHNNIIYTYVKDKNKNEKTFYIMNEVAGVTVSNTFDDC